MAARPTGKDPERTTATWRLLMPAACSAARMMLPLLGRITTSSVPTPSIAARSCGGAGIHALPAVDDDLAAELAKEFLVALADDDGDDGGAARSLCARCCRRSSRAFVCACMSLISTSLIVP